MLSLRLRRGSLASERTFLRDSRAHQASAFIAKTACIAEWARAISGKSISLPAHINALQVAAMRGVRQATVGMGGVAISRSPVRRHRRNYSHGGVLQWLHCPTSPWTTAGCCKYVPYC